MPKSVSLPFQIFTAGAMTGTNTISSSITNIMYRDSVSIELSWTGTPTGTFTVLGSNSYNPGNTQSDGGPNTGVWTPLSFSSPPVASGQDGSILMNLNELAFAWIQVQYTNSSGTGTLTGYVAAKSLGV